MFAEASRDFTENGVWRKPAAEFFDGIRQFGTLAFDIPLDLVGRAVVV